MQHSTDIRHSQATASSKDRPAVPPQPQLLDLREMALVSGGLPRGGGWLATPIEPVAGSLEI